MGVALLRIGHAEEALETFEKAVSIEYENSCKFAIECENSCEFAIEYEISCKL